jgi:Cys-tRNA(Pro)/Cys-tRNA(Cys) deacylase
LRRRGPRASAMARSSAGRKGVVRGAMVVRPGGSGRHEEGIMAEVKEMAGKGATESASNRWLIQMLTQHGADREKWRGRIILAATRTFGAGTGCTARVMVAVVDNRPVALIFPASRCVVLGRLGKLLDADEVHLASREEVDRLLETRETGAPRPSSGPRGISLLMDESLLSARELEIPSGGQDESVRLTIEDWLALANSGLGFFTVPDRGPT